MRQLSGGVERCIGGRQQSLLRDHVDAKMGEHRAQSGHGPQTTEGAG